MEHWQNLSLENLSEEFEGIVYHEEWRPIEGYDGLYEVSNFGRVKSLKRESLQNRPINLKILKQIPTKSKISYLVVNLHKGGVQYTTTVHTSVAKSFILNPKNKPTVNHKFGQTHDNRAHQLEWLTHSEQHKHAFRVLKRKPNKPNLGRVGALHAYAKRTLCITTNQEYACAKDAAKDLKIGITGISMVCHGKLKKTGGYTFRYI